MSSTRNSRERGSQKSRDKKPNSLKPTRDPGRFSYDGLDRTIHERARLGILASLYAHTDGVAFNDLKSLCKLTDGNLSRHLSVLQEAGLVRLTKTSQGSRPNTVCRLTRRGRARFGSYIGVLESIVADAQSLEAESTRGEEIPPGWSPA